MVCERACSLSARRCWIEVKLPTALVAVWVCGAGVGRRLRLLVAGGKSPARLAADLSSRAEVVPVPSCASAPFVVAGLRLMLAAVIIVGGIVAVIAVFVPEWPSAHPAVWYAIQAFEFVCKAS